MEEKKIVNVGLVAHVDAGKTTLTEQLLYHSGALRKKGNVDDGTAQTDWLSIERARGISVRSSSVWMEKDGCRINLIDTPGHVDFSGEVERSLSILDFALLVVSAVEGVQAQTELLLEALRATRTPTVVVINKIDRAGSGTERVCAELKSRFCPGLITLHTVASEGSRGCVVKRRGFDETAFCEECLLALAESRPQLLEDYLSGDLAQGRLEQSFAAAVNSAAVTPVFFASASLGVGVDDILGFLFRVVEGQKTDGGELSGVVYKVEHDGAMGKIAHVRLFGGSIKNRDGIFIPSSGKTEKVTQIRRYFGGRSADVGKVEAGDIAALCGLADIRVGDFVGRRPNRESYSLASPLLRVKVAPEDGDTSALLAALGELADEDPLLDLLYNAEKQEIQIRITGAIQLEVIGALLKERYNLGAVFSPPSVIYKETPAAAGEGFEAYTMPKPCWAVVRLLIEPGKPGSGLAYSSVVSNDDIYLRYQNHIATAVRETLRQGLFGWEVTDLNVTLIGGEHHIVHTHPMDFFVATPMAVMDGLVNTGTTLLEPFVTYKISAGEEYAGKIIGDLVRMRGEFDAPLVRSGSFFVEAAVPVASSLDFPARLGMLTSGRAVVGTRFAGYRPCPPELGASTERRGINPLDRRRWILYKRDALS